MMMMMMMIKQPTLESCVSDLSVHLNSLLKNGFYDKIGSKPMFGVRTENRTLRWSFKFPALMTKLTSQA